MLHTDNVVGPEAGTAVAEAIKSCTKLTSLNLGCMQCVMVVAVCVGTVAASLRESVR